MQYATIVLGNLVLFWTCFRGQIGLGELLWVFWAQSVLIGVAAAVRMSLLRQFSTDGFTGNGKPVPETPKGKRETVAFFLIHYGGFHAVYAAFLVHKHGAPWLATSLWGALALIAFGIGEAAGVGRRATSDRSWRPNLGTLMFMPYCRIVPMHLAILASGPFDLAGADGTSSILLLFLVLKTGADLGMQIIEDRLDAQRQAAQQQPTDT